MKGKQEADQHSAIISFRLEKEYTTIKNKEMEEQIEIKVCVCVFKHLNVVYSANNRYFRVLSGCAQKTDY